MSSPTRRIMVVGMCAIAGLLSGCSAPRGSDDASIVPLFRSTHTDADVAAVSAACNGVGGAKAVHAPGTSALARSRPLRFDVTGLNDRQQAALSTCLSRQRSVQGFEQNGPDDN